MLKQAILLIFSTLILILLVGCVSEPPMIEAIFTSTPKPQVTFTPEPSATQYVTKAIESFTATLVASSTPEDHNTEVMPTEDTLSNFSELQCDDPFCQQAYAGFLMRPIAYPGRTIIDWTYPYGSTLGGTLEVHHGVEFQNSFGTPVLAAAEGEVVFAGRDDQLVLGPYVGFYGNVVILHHPKLFDGQDLFTLYAHLSVIEVVEGEQVSIGMKIGEVGASGAANGSHLHFEVRLGRNDYNLTTNPVLWFAPVEDQEYGRMSTLVGRVEGSSGEPLSEVSLALEKIGPDGSVEASYYPLTYDQVGINAHPELGENFAVSDVPPGNYRLALVYGRLYEVQFNLKPGYIGFIKLQTE
ncbi:MAG: M23 family metallopeptidase [Anaerolineales bacterium]